MIRRPYTGFSIVELLVAIIILGVLVTIIVPRLATRTEEARKRSAQAELEHIQDAQERASIDTGYFYRLYVLDDINGGDGIGLGAIDDVSDGILDEGLNTIHNDPTRMFVDILEGGLIDATRATSIYTILTQNETIFGWHGPYITWQRDVTNLNSNDIPDDIPDDPWGKNYLFFTKQGLILEFDEDGTVVGDMVLTYTDASGRSGHSTEVFDRPTILSLGPNGLPGDGSTPGSDDARFGRGDDLMRQW